VSLRIRATQHPEWCGQPTQRARDQIVAVPM
jgi:hypothetical protein